MDLNTVSCRILVRDFKKCFDFYTQKLGFKVFWGTEDGPYASFGAANSEQPSFAIFLAKNMEMHQGYEPLPVTGDNDKVTLCIHSEDIDKDYNELESKGVKFLGKPQTIEEWEMRCAYFRDPEGNLFEIANGTA